MADISENEGEVVITLIDDASKDTGSSSNPGSKADKEKAAEIFPCKYCWRTFKNEYDCTQHVYRNHQEVPSAQCNNCLQVIGDPESVVKLKNTQNDGTIFICNYCETYMTSMSGFNFRLKTVKPKPKPFECQFCKSKFVKLDDYEWHVETCQIERQFTCKYCKRSFILEKTLVIHLEEIHHKVYQCRYCRVKLSSTSKRIQHERNHKNNTAKQPLFACPYASCRKRTNSAEQMLQHFTRHTEHPGLLLLCPLNSCGSTFESGDDLRTHSYSHMDDLKIARDMANIVQNFMKTQKKNLGSRKRNLEAETPAITRKSTRLATKQKSRLRSVITGKVIGDTKGSVGTENYNAAENDGEVENDDVTENNDVTVVNKSGSNETVKEGEDSAVSSSSSKKESTSNAVSPWSGGQHATPAVSKMSDSCNRKREERAGGLADGSLSAGGSNVSKVKIKEEENDDDDTEVEEEVTTEDQLEDHLEVLEVPIKEKPPPELIEIDDSDDESVKLKKSVLRYSDETRPFKCPRCWQTFVTRVQCNRHEATHLGSEDVPTCHHCQQVINETEKVVRLRMPSTQGTIFLCPLCEVHINTYLQFRVVKDQKQTEIKCRLCRFVSYDQAEMDVHSRKHQTGSSFKCVKCGMSFLLEETLKMHAQMHAAKENYKCKYCQRLFDSPHRIKQHEENHIQIKAYPCPITTCTRQFLEVSTLLSHLHSHQTKGDVGSYCPHCLSVIEDTDALVYHIKYDHEISNYNTNQKYECSHCNFSFTSERQLLLHEDLLHDLCITYRRNRKLDKKVVVDLDTIMCVHCNVAFATSISLKNHVEYFHNMDIRDSSRVRILKKTSNEVSAFVEEDLDT